MNNIEKAIEDSRRRLQEKTKRGMIFEAVVFTEFSKLENVLREERAKCDALREEASAREILTDSPGVIEASMVNEQLREKIITSMCYTWRHDYGLMSEGEQKALFSNMAQAFDNDIARHIPAFGEGQGR